MVNGSDSIRVCIAIGSSVTYDGVKGPGALPQPETLISLLSPKFFSSEATNLYTTRRYSSACAYRSSCSIGLSSPMALKAAFFHDVTMFHPMRPLVKWSRVEKRFASKKGGSKEVDAVMPKARCLVTAAMAEMG